MPGAVQAWSVRVREEDPVVMHVPELGLYGAFDASTRRLIRTLVGNGMSASGGALRLETWATAVLVDDLVAETVEGMVTLAVQLCQTPAERDDGIAEIIDGDPNHVVRKTCEQAFGAATDIRDARVLLQVRRQASGSGNRKSVLSEQAVDIRLGLTVRQEAYERLLNELPLAESRQARGDGRGRAIMRAMLIAMVVLAGAGCESDADVGAGVDVDVDVDVDVGADVGADVGGGADAGVDVVQARELLLVGAHIVGTGDALIEGTVQSVLVRDGFIVAIGAVADSEVDAQAERRSMTGRWLAPAFIDSHVHLAYWDVAAVLPAGGIVGVVDLGAPLERFFDRNWSPLQVIGAGPMITAVGGYPTTSWGSDGYGVECATAEEAIAAIEAAIERGARLVKIPIGAGPDLPSAALIAAIETAHAYMLPVAVHALNDVSARKASTLGADILGHTPVEALQEGTVQAWSTRTLITTLAAFGGSAAAVDNLRRLRAAGTRVLYGTDLGNSRTPGIDADELGLMQAAGMDGVAILASATSEPAGFWGFTELGLIAVGKRAKLLVLANDPRVDPLVNGSPIEVLLR